MSVMAVMVRMSATESVVSCTRMEEEGEEPTVQWAAVSTCRADSSEPPHHGLLPLLDTRPTCVMYVRLDER